MLKARIFFALPLVMVIIGLSFLDTKLSVKGLVLMPVLLVSLTFLCKELFDLLSAGGLHPRRSTVYTGTLLMAVCCWVICVGHYYHLDKSLKNDSNKSLKSDLDKPLENDANKSLEDDANKSLEDDSEQEVVPWGWASGAAMGILFTFAGGILIAFIGEMWRYKRPGGVTINLAAAIFMMGYLGLLSCFIILLRMTYGLIPLLAMISVVKLNDVGAYTIGRLLGRHKMAPELSPKKTIEGGIGGLVFGVFASWFFFYFLKAGPVTVANYLFFGLVVAVSGSLGDLAASLIKRDVGKKDSGTTIPGFGGFLDLFDSLILARPVAFFWWTFCIEKFDTVIK